MAGIYIHIPFCKQKCHYCNFFAVASDKYREPFVGALLKEIEIRKEYLGGEKINTIYFGGGTPSMLKINEINLITNKLNQVFEINPEAEITLEANPDDLNEDKLKALKNETKINRLSMGVQSFFDDDLHYLNRVHNGNQARTSIEFALKAGFQNMTIDLIYGIPGLTDEKWKKNLEIFFSYKIPHLSSYSLTIEQKTALFVLIEKGKMKNINDEESIRHFEILLEETTKNEFIHYEISNFAKEGFYSKHNSIYWLGGHYAGFGPSAHSFNGISRQWNVSLMKPYVEMETIDKIVNEKEILTESQRFNEYVMTSLRISWGCDLQHIENVFGEKYVAHFAVAIQIFIEKNQVRNEGTKYFLTNKGKLFADGIASDLFVND
ncbi:MAG TPA: radical SAM family heme chaperone HemW [Bacteroidales bacterium]